MQRIEVAGACAQRCASCACRPESRATPLADVLAASAAPDLLLGGGDATAWPWLEALLDDNRARATPQRIWLEAPARAFTAVVLQHLAKSGVHGILVQIEGVGDAMLRVLKVGDGERVIAAAEALGLETQARVVVRPKTFPIVPALARRLFPRPVWLELQRQDWGGPLVPIWPAPLTEVMRSSANLCFSGHRLRDRGYLPPCALPDVWAVRPTTWRTTFAARETPNAVLPACATCTLRDRCQWNDRDALAPEVAAALDPIRTPEQSRVTYQPVPAAIRARRPAPEVICTTPWTTLEIVDPDGRTRQCCSTWTVGDRGSVLGTTLSDVWNGEGYRAARRIMSGEDIASLCLPICSRLHDKKFAESELSIQDGSQAFVENQLLLAAEIAERRDVIRGMPLRMALCPSTYCNYNCIMCDHGRSPRRELPIEIWDELPRFLPTLQSLTLLGGEPLANPLAMKFLRSFDVAKYPDASIDFVTNGSLLNATSLKTLARCTLGDITISTNAGTPEVYERVQRGVAFQTLIENLDNLIRFRAQHHRWFGITLSFVVQPASAHTLLPFAELAHARGLRIRLMALNPENHEGLDYYLDDEVVTSVVGHVDALREYAARVEPGWLREIGAVRSAVLGEAAARKAAHAQASLRISEGRRLPLL